MLFDVLLIVVIVVIVVAFVVVAERIHRARLGQRPRRPALRRWSDQPPDPAWLARPCPRAIWLADVPFRDGTGSKVRPCVVLRVTTRDISVLRVTSQDKSHRSDYLEMETRSWDSRATHNSFLDLSGSFTILDRDFVCRVGRADDRTWDRVTREHVVGWSV